MDFFYYQGWFVYYMELRWSDGTPLDRVQAVQVDTAKGALSVIVDWSSRFQLRSANSVLRSLQ